MPASAHLRGGVQPVDGVLQPQHLLSEAVHVAEQCLALVAVDVLLTPRQLG
jgi:hypothetical protein